MAKRILILALLCALPALSAPKWVRRVTLAAACAASAADAVTTYQGKLDGLREGNPILRAHDGTPAMGRVISPKVGLCAYSAWAQERYEHSTTYTPINIGTAAMFGYVAWHNAQLTGRAKP